MKKPGFLIIVFLLYTNQTFSQHISAKTAQDVSAYHIQYHGYDLSHCVKNISKCIDNELLLFYLIDLKPRGYIIISANENLPPIIAYSFINNATYESKITDFIKNDIKIRLKAIEKLPQHIIFSRKELWNNYLNRCQRKTTIQYWPPLGTTSTEGWLESSWDQEAPYNQMCPIDPLTSIRSYTGCPATAMAMILHFHQTTNNTHLDDTDDYYHSYIGRNFYIDDDYADNGFPSFPDLNNHLDTLNIHWQKTNNNYR